jgi:transposase-like protein
VREGGEARRRYSDEDRANALAALAANAGNVLLTAEQLGIPECTLRQWATGRRHPEARQMSEEKKAPLADRLEQIAHDLLDDLADPDRRRASSLKETATALGIALDKMQLLRGRATAITQHDLSTLSDDELARQIQDLEGRLPPPPGGAGPEAGPGGPS